MNLDEAIKKKKKMKLKKPEEANKKVHFINSRTWLFLLNSKIEYEKSMNILKYENTNNF